MGSGVVAGLILVAIVVALIAHPTECTRTECHETDTAAGAQVAFLGVLLVPIYALVLPGAAIGKLLGRGLRRLVNR